MAQQVKLPLVRPISHSGAMALVLTVQFSGQLTENVARKASDHGSNTGAPATQWQTHMEFKAPKSGLNQPCHFGHLGISQWFEESLSLSLPLYFSPTKK